MMEKIFCCVLMMCLLIMPISVFPISPSATNDNLKNASDEGNVFEPPEEEDFNDNIPVEEEDDIPATGSDNSYSSYSYNTGGRYSDDDDDDTGDDDDDTGDDDDDTGDDDDDDDDDTGDDDDDDTGDDDDDDTGDDDDCPCGSYRNGRCIPCGPCEGVTCPPGFYCKNGECVKEQDPINDPCKGINCPDGEHCEGGDCVLDNPCFLAGTKIAMADGTYKNIEDIKIDDLVKSYDEETSEIKDGEVIDVFRHNAYEMLGEYYLILNGELKVTINHPIYKDGEWVDAGELKIGDKVSIEKSAVEITSIEKVYEKVPTYNFEVETYHDYIVSTQKGDILVHNKAENPCEGVTCPPGQHCLGGGCVDNGPCYGVTCPPGQHCSGGDCEPDNTDPCAGVTCPPGQHCSGGDCEPDEGLTTTPNCCFPAGTQITMADRTTQNIEDIEIGDKVLSYDVEQDKFIISTVTNIIITLRRGVYDINDGLVSPTDDHPLYVRKPDGQAGWAAVDPDKSKIAYDNRGAMSLEVGDVLLTADEIITTIESMVYRFGTLFAYTFNMDSDAHDSWANAGTTIESIVYRQGTLVTYTFSVDSDAHDYFANNILVSNRAAAIKGTCTNTNT